MNETTSGTQGSKSNANGASDANGVIEVPFGSAIAGSKEGCFVMLTARSKIYENYEHVDDATKQKPHRVVLMVARWDGRIGFPGGMREANESLEQAVRREAQEEVNFDIGDRAITPVCSHHIVRGKIVVHAHHVDLGNVDVDTLKKISRDAVDARHFASEGTPFWLHLADYGKGKGHQAMMNSGALTSAVREELEALLQRISLD